ncbi:MAG: response regulator transcription factor [Vulcanimicrobiaceae bacterium]
MLGPSEASYAAVTVTTARHGRRSGSDLSKFGLTRREQEVVELLVRGAATSEISASLGVAISTVIQHIKSAMSKTGTHGRVELVLAISGGIEVMRSYSGRSRLPKEATR